MKYILAFWNALCALNRLPLHKDYSGTYCGGHNAAPVGRSHAPVHLAHCDHLVSNETGRSSSPYDVRLRAQGDSSANTMPQGW